MLACCARSWGVGRYTAPTPTELVTVASYSALSSPRRAALAMIRKLREEALRDKKTKPLGRHEGAPRGSDTLATRSRGLAPFVLLSVATHGLFIQVGHSEAPASIPRQPRRVAQFTNVSATGQIGSRTDLPHCTSRHHFDVARAARLAPAVRPGELLPDQRAPEPLVASAPSPEFPFGLGLKALLRRQVPTLPSKPRGINICHAENRASADVSSG